MRDMKEEQDEEFDALIDQLECKGRIIEEQERSIAGL